MADTQEPMSQSAKRRAAKKARDAAAKEAEAPAPVPAPKAEAPKSAAKAKAKAQTAAPADTAPKAEAKSKAKAKAEPKAEPKAEAKAKAKADPKAKAAVPAQAEQPKPKAQAKEQPKAASKAKAKAKAEPAPKKEEEPVPSYIQFDDGKGGDWEECTGKSKKQEKQQEKKKQKEEEEAKKKQEEEEAAKKAEIEAKKAAKQAQKQAAKATAAPKAKAEEPKPEVVAPTPEPAKPTPTTTAAAPEPEKPTEPPDATATVKIPDGKIGRVIGPKGANIAKIQEATGIKKIDTSGDTVTIIGPPAAVPLAEAAVKELIEKGYMQLSYTDFAEGGVMVHPSSFPDIIGQRGAVINEIKKATGVEIKIPEVPKGGKDGFGKGGAGGGDSTKKYKVEIIGDKENVEKAKDIINSILMYGHHELTHPDEVHEEMEIAQECYGFIIGRGGSELRHIQNNYQVRVNIPRATSVNEKVVIVGLSSDVERAVKHINKLMMDEDEKAKEREEKAAKGTAEKAPRRRDDDDEGPMEPWMAAYIKKR